MRRFLITTAVFTMASAALSNSGLAYRIWPLHPLLCTIFGATLCGIAAQFLIQGNTAQRRR